jgi:hypothetical protein
MAYIHGISPDIPPQSLPDVLVKITAHRFRAVDDLMICRYDRLPARFRIIGILTLDHYLESVICDFPLKNSTNTAERSTDS